MVNNILGTVHKLFSLENYCNIKHNIQICISACLFQLIYIKNVMFFRIRKLIFNNRIKQKILMLKHSKGQKASRRDIW